MAPVQNITLLGCGLMGQPMGKRILAAGFPLTVWNRTRAKAEFLTPHGAQVAETPAQAVAQADLVITMLEHGGVVAEVLFGRPDAPANTASTASAANMAAIGGLRPGTLVVDMSSILPEQARDHARRLSGAGASTLDAPVSGGTVGAEAGTLAIMAGGPQDAFERARPVLEVLGRPVHVGPEGSGQLAKLANQMIVGITIGAVAEALLMGRQGGADMVKVREALRGGFAESRVMEGHGQRMVEGDFAKRGSLAIQLKDLRNALHTAHQIGFEAPITTELERLYAQAFEHGLADLDQSALFCELAQRQARPAC